VAAPTVTVQVAAAEEGKIERKIGADAVIYPLRQAALVPKVNAPVNKFYVERGSHVHAGELLAQLENQDLLAARTDSEGAYQQAQAAYETTTKQSLPEETQKAELDARAAREVKESAQKTYEGLQKLLQQGAVARKTVEDANVAYIQARNQDAIADITRAIELPRAPAGSVARALFLHSMNDARFGYNNKLLGWLRLTISDHFFR